MNADNQRNTGLLSVRTDDGYHHHQNTKARLLRMGFPRRTNRTEVMLIVAGSNRRPLLKDLLDVWCDSLSSPLYCPHQALSSSASKMTRGRKGWAQLAGQAEIMALEGTSPSSFYLSILAPLCAPALLHTMQPEPCTLGGPINSPSPPTTDSSFATISIRIVLVDVGKMRGRFS
jgi:hypothetical protein